MKTRTLYRPVGLRELELITESNFMAFPPRLEWQPIFYPVMNEEYAAQIANDWNTEDEFSGYCGFVTAFNLSETYLNQFEVKNVGGFIHNELWIPAERLKEFNRQIIDSIKITKAFYGSNFKMPTDNKLINIINNIQ